MNDWTLLVEDEFFISDLYQRILSEAGFSIKIAQDGPSGLEMALQGPKLILLDIMLPRMNGLDVLDKLKANPQTQKIPVVLITNLGQEEIIKQAAAKGAQGYMLKMRVEPQELITIVSTFLKDPTYCMNFDTLTYD